MVFLHDSMVLIRKFAESDLRRDVAFLWEFDEHSHDDDATIRHLLFHLGNNRQLREMHMIPHKWSGCFGGTTVIDIGVLIGLEKRFQITGLVRMITNARHRMAFERVLAIALFADHWVSAKHCSLFGSLFTHANLGHNRSLDLDYHGAVIKTWNWRCH